MIASILCIALWLFFAALIVRILLSWFPMEPGGVGEKVFGVAARITDPVLRPLRAVLPPVRLGNMGLDLSPLIPLIGAQILIGIIC